ncbi:MAG: hypothetical protein IPN95_26015 [Bacteroidetes bacterium]|nr:hypothetical protein [Bacteroidota bacterium]
MKQDNVLYLQFADGQEEAFEIIFAEFSFWFVYAELEDEEPAKDEHGENIGEIKITIRTGKALHPNPELGPARLHPPRLVMHPRMSGESLMLYPGKIRQLPTSSPFHLDPIHNSLFYRGHYGKIENIEAEVLRSEGDDYRMHFTADGILADSGTAPIHLEAIVDLKFSI